MLKICRNTFNIRLNLHLHKEVLHINWWGTVMLEICRNTYNIRLNVLLQKKVLHINRWGTVSTSCRWRLGTVMGCGGTVATTGVSTSFPFFETQYFSVSHKRALSTLDISKHRFLDTSCAAWTICPFYSQVSRNFYGRDKAGILVHHSLQRHRTVLAFNFDRGKR